ncbi:integrase [Pseudomonas coronafaciens]|uniref:integrase n=1 Tax=Pseudomonas coronafaciens TaxID=53409 RepID=UPI000F0086F0|nr:integrase [Pseudomonas coronafaciens]
MYTVKIKSYLRQVSGVTIVDINKLSLAEIEEKIDELGIHQIAFATKDETIFHVGSHCFHNRYRIGATALYQCQRFDLDANKCKALDGWARNAITDVKTGAISQSTFISNSRELNQLLCWSYKNGHSKLFDNVENYYEAYSDYSKMVYEKHMEGKYAYHTAAIKQGIPFSILYWLFPECSVNYKPALPKVPTNTAYNPTPVPPEQEVAHGLGLCTEIFSVFTEALLNGWKYPFQVNLMGERLWVFPNQWLCHTQKATPPEVSTALWHYKSGTLRPQTHEFRIKRYNRALETIAEENQNPQTLTTHRHRLGKWAHDSFVLMFAANTGMNEQQIRDLEWLTGEYEVLPSTQGFRTVKWRAGRKVQSFTIATRFIKEFEKYLKLRSFLTRERPTNSLFIQIPVVVEKRWRPLQPNALRKLGDAIRQYLDESFPFLSYRQLRLYKYNYLLKEFGVVAANQIMQSSVGTIAKAYSTAADDVATKEISAFYNLLSEAHEKNRQTKIQKGIPAGHCVAPGNAIPLTEIGHPVAEPSCNNFITCLFCEHFVAHATDNDVRKLLSLKYFLEEIRNQSISAEEFEKLNGATVRKIDYIVERLRDTSTDFNERIDRIEKEVFGSEILTDYWATLLENLVRIGAIK